MRNILVCAAVTLLLCAALSLRMNTPLSIFIPRIGPPIGNVRPAVHPWGGPAPLTPQQTVAFTKAAKWELAGRSAKAKRDYAGAEAAFHAETQVPHYPVPPWTWVDLGLMRDYQGKRQEAFEAYQKGFPNGRGAWGNSPELAEAAARFGAMCEDRGLHENACECYYTSRQLAGSVGERFLDYTLDAKTTSASLARSLLYVALGIALEMDKPEPSAEALAAFRAAVRLAPGDPRPQYFLAYGLRRAGRFSEAETALQKVSVLDKRGRLKAEVEQSQAKIHEHSRDW